MHVIFMYQTAAYILLNSTFANEIIKNNLTFTTN